MKRKVSATTRLLHDLFTQYQSTFLAFCELINNSIQAEAKNISISIDYAGDRELSATQIKKIVIKDDGIGVHQNNIQDRLMDFGDSSKKGGKGILIIPSALGYGVGGNSSIPPNSVLIFNIHLLDVK